MKTDRDIRAPVRHLNVRARADSDDEFDPDNSPWTFSGIAVAPGDILHMQDGTPILMTEAELRKAADTQTGEPVTADHPTDDSGRPEYPPDTDDTHGKVINAGYIDGRGVGYEAIVHDEDLARGLHSGSYEVSVHQAFGVGETDPETGALVAEDIEFFDLSIVSKGDSPSNSVHWGPNQELAAWATGHDIPDELSDPDSARSEGLLRQAAATLDVGLDRLKALASDEPAESGTIEDSDAEPDSDMDESTIETLVDEHGFSRDSLEEMADDDIQRLHEKLVDGVDGDGEAQSENKNQSGDDNVAKVDLGDHSSLEEKIDSMVDDRVEASHQEMKKGSKVDQIIAHSDEWDSDDKDELMASSDTVVDRLHSQVTTASAAGLPGSPGRPTALAGGGGTGSSDDSQKYEELVADMSDPQAGDD